MRAWGKPQVEAFFLSWLLFLVTSLVIPPDGGGEGGGHLGNSPKPSAPSWGRRAGRAALSAPRASPGPTGPHSPPRWGACLGVSLREGGGREVQPQGRVPALPVPFVAEHSFLC